MERLTRKNPKLTEAMETLIKRNLTLTKAQQRNRLYFAFENRNTDWSNVVFSDEIKFGKVGVWASINKNGPWKLLFFDGKFTSQEYISILDAHVLPLFHRNQDMILMQDNAPAHKSFLVRSWQENHPEVNIVNFPKKAFDINPMTNVWIRLKDQLEHVPQYAMRGEIAETWERMKNDPEYFYDLYLGMQQTMEEIINRRGSFLKM